jgi:hypothetical protein
VTLWGVLVCGATTAISGPPAVTQQALAATSAVEVDHIVGVVDKEILTDSQLRIEARLSLAWREGEVAAHAPLSRELLAALRHWTVQQMLIAAQARRLGADDVSDEDVAARLATLVGRFATPTHYAAFCANYGITDAAVSEILARDLRNERYMIQRMRTRLLGGGDAQAIAPERYAAAVKVWLEELRQSAELRLEGPDGQLELVHPQ